MRIYSFFLHHHLNIMVCSTHCNTFALSPQNDNRMNGDNEWSSISLSLWYLCVKNHNLSRNSFPPNVLENHFKIHVLPLVLHIFYSCHGIDGIFLQQMQQLCYKIDNWKACHISEHSSHIFCKYLRYCFYWKEEINRYIFGIVLNHSEKFHNIYSCFVV